MGISECRGNSIISCLGPPHGVAVFSSEPGLAIQYPYDREQISGVGLPVASLVEEQVVFEVEETKDYSVSLVLMALSSWFVLMTMVSRSRDTWLIGMEWVKDREVEV